MEDTRIIQQKYLTGVDGLMGYIFYLGFNSNSGGFAHFLLLNLCDTVRATNVSLQPLHALTNTCKITREFIKEVLLLRFSDLEMELEVVAKNAWLKVWHSLNTTKRMPSLVGPNVS